MFLLVKCQNENGQKWERKWAKVRTISRNIAEKVRTWEQGENENGQKWERYRVTSLKKWERFWAKVISLWTHCDLTVKSLFFLTFSVGTPFCGIELPVREVSDTKHNKVFDPVLTSVRRAGFSTALKSRRPNQLNARLTFYLSPTRETFPNLGKLR